MITCLCFPFRLCGICDCTRVLNYIGVIGVVFGLTVPLKIVRKKIEQQIWQETLTKEDQGTKKKTLAIDLLWPQED